MSKEKENIGQEFKDTLELIFKYRVNMKPQETNEEIEALFEKRRQEYKELGIDEQKAQKMWKKMGFSPEVIERTIRIMYYNESSFCSESSSNSNS